MRLSKSELLVMCQIAKGNRSIIGIASALKKSKAQVYRSGHELAQKGFLVRFKGYFEPAKTAPASLLLQLLAESPGLTEALADSGLEFLTLLLEPKSFPELGQESEIRKTRLFKKIKQARMISLVGRRNKKYELNEKLWGKAIDFLKELKKHEETTDQRVPGNSAIYYKNDKEIVFSSMEELDATLTAFSAYAEFGIRILSHKRYYYLPSKKLSKKEVFKHSLYVTEKEPDTRHITFVALFYAKFKKELRGIKHAILNKINKVLEGQRIPGYPSLDEMKERAEVYDIRL